MLAKCWPAQLPSGYLLHCENPPHLSHSSISAKAFTRVLRESVFGKKRRKKVLVYRRKSTYECGWSKTPTDLIVPGSKMRAGGKWSLWGNSLGKKMFHGVRVFSQAPRESQSWQSFRLWLQKSLRNLIQVLNNALRYLVHSPKPPSTAAATLDILFV